MEKKLWLLVILIRIRLYIMSLFGGLLISDHQIIGILFTSMSVVFLCALNLTAEDFE